ncbi:hypothetical protein AGMMS49944_08900 [Spirochaetia bacterium]|nr:hypothetical protein AGMMS49944_08900 [Spirochaetia bacterium]
MQTAIENVYDGPKRPARQLEAKQFTLDFAYSENATELDAGIRETAKGYKLSIMAMGIALYRVDVAGLFIDLGFRKFGEYIDKLAEDIGLNRSTLYNWEYVGEAFIKYRSDLERIGFSEEDGPTKLPLLARALEHHSKQTVFKNLTAMTYRQFDEWARGPVQAIENHYTSVKLKGDQVLVGREPLAVFSDALKPDDRKYFQSWMVAAAEAKENNEYLRGYKFYDEKEARIFDRIYARELKALRKKR